MRHFLTLMLFVASTSLFAQDQNSYAMGGEFLEMGTHSVEDAPVRITHRMPLPSNPAAGTILVWRVMVPQDFDGLLVKEDQNGYRIQVTGQDFEGPFDVKTWKDGKIISHEIFEKAQLVTDTMYVEQPAPPYDLKMEVFHFYEAEKTANKLMRIEQKK